jgi:Flp pilus assembly protein CpaB
MVAALVGGLAYLNGVGQQQTYAVLVATRDLPRGSVIANNDFVAERVVLPESMAPAALPANAAADVVGQRLAEAAHAGVPLLQAQIAGPTDVIPGFQRIAFPVGPEHAAGGRLRTGDSVRIYVTGDRGKTNARTEVALDRAVVSAVGYQDVGLASSASSDAGQRATGKLAWIQVLVEDVHAGPFVQALAAGDPDVAVLPPSPAVSASEVAR